MLKLTLLARKTSAASKSSTERYQFENLTWEVEVTESVLKWFRKRSKKQRGMCDAAIQRIRTIAQGQQRLEHLRIMFVTKNPVLRGEVAKTFAAFRKGVADVPQPVSGPKAANFDTFESVVPYDYPLFLSGKSWLRMLDNSLPGEHYFSGDGAQFESWDDEAGGLSSMEQYFEAVSDSDSDDAAPEDVGCDDELLIGHLYTAVTRPRVNFDAGCARWSGYAKGDIS
eukprot:g4091.t1